jgi:prolipoprotein diacylglyceryl transferase
VNGHIVWDFDPVLVTVPVDWLRIIGLIAVVGLGIAAARYFWRGHKRGSEEDRSVGWTLVTVLALTLVVIKFVRNPLEIRYYGVLFAAALFVGYYVMRWQFRRGGYGDDKAESLFLYAALGIIIGARLGHVLFYEPDKFLSNPLEILKIWHGGLASHGATIGVLLALWLFHRKQKIPYVEVTDRLAMSIALCSSFVRIGNFLNSEIVGRAWDGPWAVVFKRYDLTPRHPSQVYEVLMSWIVFGILVLVDSRLKEERPRGLMSSMLIMGYFILRFVVEFFKEYQVDAFISRGSPLTMGQVLSIPFVLVGLAWFVYAIRKGRYVPEQAAGEEARPTYVKKKRKKR